MIYNYSIFFSPISPSVDFFNCSTSNNSSVFNAYKKDVESNANNIQNYSISNRNGGKSVSYTNYLELSKIAVSSINDPFSQRPYAVKYIKLDQYGKNGLRPHDFNKVMQIAINNNYQCKSYIDTLINQSNYNDSQKNGLLNKLSSSTDHTVYSNSFPVFSPYSTSSASADSTDQSSLCCSICQVLVDICSIYEFFCPSN
jgi:hypothetical protein